MSGGLKIRRGGRTSHSSDLFCGIDVTVNMSVLAHRADAVTAPHPMSLRYRAGITKLDKSGQHRHAALFFKHSLHSVTAALLVVNETVPVRIRLWEPIFLIVRKAKSRARGLQVHFTRCESGAHVHFSIGYERASVLTWFGTKKGPGQHRGIRPHSKPM